MIFGVRINGVWHSWHSVKCLVERLEQEYKLAKKEATVAVAEAQADIATERNLRKKAEADFATERNLREKAEADFATERNLREKAEMANRNLARELSECRERNRNLRAELSQKNNTIHKLQVQVSSLPKRGSNGRFEKKKPTAQPSMGLAEGEQQNEK